MMTIIEAAYIFFWFGAYAGDYMKNDIYQKLSLDLANNLGEMLDEKKHFTDIDEAIEYYC